MVPVQTTGGASAAQPSRVIGVHEGPRWLLRATLMGRPAVEEEAAKPWEETIRASSSYAVAARRCRPASPAALTLPPDAERPPDG